MFEYLQTCSPEITVADVKGGLRSIGRQDVIDVLTKYEQSEYTTDNIYNNLYCAKIHTNNYCSGASKNKYSLYIIFFK